MGFIIEFLPRDYDLHASRGLNGIDEQISTFSRYVENGIPSLAEAALNFAACKAGC